MKYKLIKSLASVIDEPGKNKLVPYTGFQLVNPKILNLWDDFVQEESIVKHLYKKNSMAQKKASCKHQIHMNNTYKQLVSFWKRNNVDFNDYITAINYGINGKNVYSSSINGFTHSAEPYVYKSSTFKLLTDIGEILVTIKTVDLPEQTKMVWFYTGEKYGNAKEGYGYHTLFKGVASTQMIAIAQAAACISRNHAVYEISGVMVNPKRW